MGAFWETKEYKQKMIDDIKLTESNVDEYLLTHSIKLSQYISDFKKISRLLNAERRKMNDAYSEKWSYYRFKFEYTTTNADANTLTEKDKEITEYKFKINQLETELKYFEDYISTLKQNYWKIKTFQDIRSFNAGK